MCFSFDFFLIHGYNERQIKILVARGQRKSVPELKKGMGCKAPRGNGAVSADVSGSSAESRSLGKPEKAEPGTFEA